MARFPRALRGYFASEVDALIVRIEGTLGVHDEPAPPITSAELRETRLGVVLHGYDRRAVDAALLEYVRQLEHRERGEADPYVETVSGQLPWLIRWVEDAQFPITRVRAAYDEREVDAFLDRVLAGLRGEGPAVSGQAVREAVFGGVFFQPGYAEPDVDRFLDELAAALDHLQPARATPTPWSPPPASPPPPAPEAPVAEPPAVVAKAEPAAPPERPDVPAPAVSLEKPRTASEESQERASGALTTALESEARDVPSPRGGV
ncbi:DivIVA domain-containing protein [Actinocorallia sp. API 0066]|uniref:DivIVA domain-containing protein n=1 Tax=Actinocorallia sp. API 0066 TaxID=2896846 RepID=UPI001E5778D3|nr:DivIVA domain-containing protein [Actinocorallia sp. API 0066]MCD0448424.1 DivIVA domain-containing protein [Actinocorallia sp. API 0066]